ncbi:MAG: M13 family metallopeptidase [Ruminococcaceae bacterium]|nr:M13 family metallopeptidase [Oscillospiraceae bacterium]
MFDPYTFHIKETIMEKVRIQDDLYTCVNQAKLEELVIPDDMPVAGGFAALNTDVEKLMIGEFNAMCKDASYPNEHLERACTLFTLAKDVKRKKKHGIKPALKNLAILKKLGTMRSYNLHTKELILKNVAMPLNIMVEPNMKDTTHHCVMIQGATVILPDVSYYKNEQQRDMMLGMWSGFAKQVLAIAGHSEEEIDALIKDTLAFDALIAKYAKSQEEWSEYTKMYNPMKTGRVAGMVKPLNLKKLLSDLFGFVPEEIIVAEPRYFKNFKEVFNQDNFEMYKKWAYVVTLMDSCGLLSEELRDLGGAFRRALSGIAAVSSPEKFAYQLASSMYSEPVGLYYGEKYFGEEAKKDITEIVQQIVATYQKRIASNDILEPATKEKAILKLSKMGLKLAYPDRVEEIYNKLVFDKSKSLFDIVTTLRKIRMEENFAKLNKEVDRTHWAMPGHMVNACYDPFVNDITFPAAILQSPFYSIHQTRSENLGGIGAVIGHEISHAFDSNGAKCDELGNLNNWWTKADERKFNKKVNAMIKQFDGIELPWGTVNGKFTVSENIADNGGMAVTLDIMSNTEGASFEEYFSNWARVWCQKAKPEYQALLLQVDVHGPCYLRANMPPRNFPEWYAAFNVKKTDGMYLAPSKRVVIW